MYPLFRLLTTIVKSRNKTINCLSQDSINFYCRPWDIDILFEMNNGRAITLFDLGRVSLVSKCGLLKILIKKKWGLVVAGSSIMYRKRIRSFDRVTMYTRVINIDDKWIYLEQSMWVKSVPCCSIVIRTAVTSKHGIISTNKVLEALGEAPINPKPEGWVLNWINNEKERIWPPNINPDC
ncbi:thioeseterase [Vibrio fortis]|uniref:Thioeseterase n=1 Tax=Vibrio fortis TaxID=212667 RepID=A0A066UK75_9VIBR|nr:thioesterase family protein [Vibrio fortis]KDN26252.1 thioeseterase [Vibrio fortis]